MVSNAARRCSRNKALLTPPPVAGRPVLDVERIYLLLVFVRRRISLAELVSPIFKVQCLFLTTAGSLKSNRPFPLEVSLVSSYHSKFNSVICNVNIMMTLLVAAKKRCDSCHRFFFIV